MMKHLITLSIIFHIIGLIYAQSTLVSSYSHPDKVGYQSQLPNSDKHKYGYELKENKHFHHTTSEKDGVRLGCYGYELNGQKFSTQYVADSHGYRIVSSNDLITVYPKSGGERQASFQTEFKEDPLLTSNIRYFFPEGCTEHIPRLPVTLKTTELSKPTTPVYSHVPVPSSEYLPPPGPPHIYAPNQIQPIVKPSSPSQQTNTYLPPAKPTTPRPPPVIKPVVFVPNQIQPVVKPSNVYLPAPTTSKPPVTYLPPPKPSTTTRPPVKPTNVYLPAEKPTNVYLPPQNSLSNVRPPSKPSINLEIVPPAIPTDTCGSSLSCCDEATEGKIVIPIALKSFGSSGCCGRVAKLILPVTGLDKESIRKLAASHPEEIDAKLLIAKILQNLL